MSFGAVTLNAARGAGEASSGVKRQGLVDREREIAVGAGRDGSGLIGS